MTATQANVLVIADDATTQELVRLRGGNGFAHYCGAYPALEELAQRPFDAVLLGEDLPDFPALIRAARRLCPDARLYALCSPAGEARLRAGEGAELDDYFIFPPTGEELERVFARPQEAQPQALAGEELSPAELSRLIDAATSMPALREAVAGLVKGWTGLPTAWTSVGGRRRGEPLLLIDGDLPQMLLAEGLGMIAPSLRRRLSSLQVLMAPLAAQVRRLEALHRLAITDHLTGAYNRRYFYHFTDQLLERARSERFRVTLLLFDIDNFKHYNDTYSHSVGDEILREVTALLKQVTREQDIVARLGGDEYSVLFWDAEPPRRPDSQHPSSADALTQRFVKALARHEFACLGKNAKGTLTISGGLATFPWDGQNCEELLRHADQGLREAKGSGKNSIYIIGQPGEE